MKFIHTADLHLVSPDKPEGAHRLEVLRELCALARGKDALVIAGDLFDSAAEAAPLESALRGLFAEIRPTQVLIIPGNHDTLRGDSPFDGRFDFGQGGNVKLFTKTPFELHTVRNTEFYGFPFARSKTSFELTRGLEAKTTRRARVGMMHGLAADRPQLAAFALDASNREEGGESVLRDADLRGAAFNYTALGHIHRQEVWELSETCAIAYAGSPDPVRITETGPRRALAVDLDEETGAAAISAVELKSAGRALTREFFIFPGEEERLPQNLRDFLSSCGPDAKAAALISGLGDAAKAAQIRSEALAEWRPRFPLGLDIRVQLEQAPSENGDMALYGFMRRMQERAAQAKEPHQLELERRILATGWRALLGMKIDPEDLLERK